MKQRMEDEAAGRTGVEKRPLLLFPEVCVGGVDWNWECSGITTAPHMTKGRWWQA